MAHFAELDTNNIVQRVIAISNDIVPDPAPENEHLGADFINNVLGLGGIWKQTSYNTRYVCEKEYDDSVPPKWISTTIVGSEHTDGGTPLRGTYAGIGYIYDPATDTFTPPEANDETVA